MDAQARSEVLRGVAVGRLNLELRGAQLAFRMDESQELRESSRALLAQSQQLFERIGARNNGAARGPQPDGLASP